MSITKEQMEQIKQKQEAIINKAKEFGKEVNKEIENENISKVLSDLMALNHENEMYAIGHIELEKYNIMKKMNEAQYDIGKGKELEGPESDKIINDLSAKLSLLEGIEKMMYTSYQITIENAKVRGNIDLIIKILKSNSSYLMNIFPHLLNIINKPSTTTKQKNNTLDELFE